VDKVKQEEHQRHRRIRSYNDGKRQHFSHNYLQRKNSELEGAKTAEIQINNLENMESQLLEKLKNTQANMSQVNKEYMDALDQSYGSQESRIQSLKNKLEKYRSKYMYGNEDHNRNVTNGNVRTAENRSKSEK
jgi:hypothetical protein